MSQFKYAVDVVLVIDATNSMTRLIDMVKNSALEFHGKLTRMLELQGKSVDELRVRCIAYRDIPDNGVDGLQATPFFSMPQNAATLREWIRNLKLIGNTTYPESGLTALSAAIHSQWTRAGSKRRHVIVLWADNTPHSLESEASLVESQVHGVLDKTFDGLTDSWHAGNEPLSVRRLVLFAPAAGAWQVIGSQWDNVVHYASVAGEGLRGETQDELFAVIVNSI